MMSISVRWIMVLMIAMAVSVPAAGQDKRASREREALRRAQQQVQKANEDLAAAQQQLEAAERQRERLARDARIARERAAAEAARGQQLQSELERLRAERDALRTQRTEQDQRLQEVAARASQLERELVAAQQRVRQLDALGIGQRDAIAACEGRNAKLYETGRALVDECRDRSATDRVLRLEPFTGIHRVRIENMLEAYRDRLDEQRPTAGVSDSK